MFSYIFNDISDEKTIYSLVIDQEEKNKRQYNTLRQILNNVGCILFLSNCLETSHSIIYANVDRGNKQKNFG